MNQLCARFQRWLEKFFKGYFKIGGNQVLTMVVVTHGKGFAKESSRPYYFMLMQVILWTEGKTRTDI